MFSTGQNLLVERERQRAALLTWETQFLYWVAAGCRSADTPLLAESEFGLWMHHKGAAVFQGAEERVQIEREVKEIDAVLLPMLRLGRKRSTDSQETVHAVKSHASQLRFLLSSLFERLASLDAGRDVLTQLLNRRFLDVILSRENRLARSSGGHSFAVMMLDIDHFKRINDQYGHQAGDLVLQHTAMLLLNSVRGGDYVFRYGGEEFTVVLVEVDLARAQVIAEKVRERIAGEAARLPDGHEIRLAVSIGLAGFEGHPDPMRTLERADKALYRAKEGGRNRVELG
ncbi:GGDEF domain-containing protein [Denitromonas ohlonensis]|uniref:diguanylate cyclase n=2 Tax=Denitromonas TaxID=139331 RepID=A0A557RTK5_9RHOO|nr:GGDEF domain-containing protein [Denitromonas ohlonensis]TVO68472.1 GGDEF domain-containing protein [Denitromonas ohlonensis]TVO74750.1 GGDEF domain-containing protein [Denitromonas ohlonensis]TVT72232.1 MAG: GGDEF domain-containing protein [Denitromonas halophila]